MKDDVEIITLENREDGYSRVTGHDDQEWIYPYFWPGQELELSGKQVTVKWYNHETAQIGVVAK